jgi:hypothetical protein
MFISIGPNCHPAWNLKMLGLRSISLPFDWLLTNKYRVFEYTNDLINSNFKNFTKNLTYNHRGKVISKNYNFVEFFHYDLIKNTNLNRPEDNNKNLLEMMTRRANRFMNIISNKNNEVVFLCMLHHTNIIKEGNINNEYLYKDMLNFDINNNIKCNFRVLVYLYNDNDDYELIIPDDLSNLKHFIFDKYIKNNNASSIYGDLKDFEFMLKKNKLI